MIAVLAIVATNFLIPRLPFRARRNGRADAVFPDHLGLMPYGALFFGEALEPATLLGTSIIVASGI